MNSKFTFTFLLMALFATVNAQIIYEDDFESYANGSRLAAVANNAFWDTWTSDPGSAEDGVVTDAQALSGANSLYISGSNDVLLRVSDAPLTTGRYRVTVNMFVQEDRYAYYNLLHLFDGAESSWATQSYFRPTGGCNTDAGEGDVAQFEQPTGEWFEMSYIVDLDDDFATIYFGDEELVSWKWSTGAFGAGTSPTFEAINFFAWANEGTPGFYVDDIAIEQVTKPGSDIILNAELNSSNQVELDWTEAAGAIEYVLTNQGNLLENTTENTSLIEKPYPQTFDFKVGAHYNLDGYVFSDSETLELAGGKDREFVLFEVATGTWCPNCPSAARGVDQMHDEGFQVGILEYHGGGTDNYIVPDGTARIGYYGITGYPTTLSDGALEILGGSFGGNQYTTFAGMYDTRKARRALYDFEMEVVYVGGNEYKVVIDAEELYSFFDGPVNLRIALTESEIPESWQGVPQLDFVVRDMFPDATGLELDFSGGPISLEYPITVADDFVIDHCEVVAFLQHDASQEVLTGDVIRLENVSSTVNKELTASVEVFPNPIENYFITTGLTNGQASVFDQKGALVHQFEITSLNHEESFSNFNAGSYILQIETNEGLVVKQLMKK